MGLDYSQKRLVSAPLHGKNDPQSRRLKLYAFWTGLMSTCISLAHLLIAAFK